MTDQHDSGVDKDLRAGLFGTLWITFLSGLIFWDLKIAVAAFLMGAVLTGVVVLPNFIGGVSCD